MDHSLWGWLEHWDYLLLFFGPALEILVVVVPGEIILVLAGYLAARGSLDPVYAILVGFAGAMSGITSSFVLGRTAGMRLVRRYGRWLFLSEQRIEKVHGWFERIGTWSLTIGYFIPSFRHVMAIVAGIARLPWPSFVLHAYPGALAWVVTLVLLGYYLGRPVIEFFSEDWHWVALGVTLALLAGGVFFWLRKRRRNER